MLELIVVACLVASPDDCTNHRLRLTVGGMDAGQCMYKSVTRVAQWQQMHRKWKVKSWKCALIVDERPA